MKILKFNSNTNHTSLQQSLTLLADSCARPHMRPWFIPGQPDMWTASVCAAVRIGRLGKAISEKFAPRYYSEYTLVAVFEPASAETSPTPAAMLDDSVIVGEWTPIQPDAQGMLSVSTTDPDGIADSVELPLDLDLQFVNAAIAGLSHDATFRTGDMIILPTALAPITLRPDTHLRCAVNSNTILDFKIK